MTKVSLICVCCILLSNCTPQSSSQLEQALSLSGSNRIHLEQVLKHYSRNKEDSLKFKAACYLIENMPGHGWYESIELENYKNWIDSTYSDREYPFKATLYEAFFQQPDAFHGLTFFEDIKHIDSTFLITHIDSTFSSIKKRPWLETLTFKQICEYILPYRVGYEPPQLLHEMQDSVFRTQILPLLYFDDIRYNTEQLFKAYQNRHIRIDENPLILYKDKLITYKIVSCEAICINQAWHAKLLMCPFAIDMNPAFPNMLNRHRWPVIIDNTQANSINHSETEALKQGKIYRKTFTRNVCPTAETEDFVPPLFSTPFYQDVTACYTNVKDVRIAPKSSETTHTYAYLCVFNDLKWQPIAYSKQKDGVFYFKDMGKGVVYLPVSYSDITPIAISSPFAITQQGNIRFFKADTTTTQTLTLTRKFPQKSEVELYNRNFLGSILEASNNTDFKDKKEIGRFTAISSLQQATLNIHPTQAYRYWRIASMGSFIVGECTLYDEKGEKITPMITPDMKTAFDDDPISYYLPKKDFIIDIGKEGFISKIEITLRNDGNSVWPGHWYQLYYHDGDDWHSLGIKKSTAHFITFDNVPHNALLWLRDLTTGKEEGLFTVENGQVRFW